VGVAVVAAAFVAVGTDWGVRRAVAGDIQSYFEAGEAVWRGGDPYAGSNLATAGYLCAPYFALLMVPLVLLPRLVAGALWFVLLGGSLILLFCVSLYFLESPVIPLGAWLKKKLANLGRGKWNWVLIATAAVSVRLWWDNLGSGQINVPLWAFGFLGVYLIQRHKKITGGAVLGAAVLVKLMAAPLVLYLLIRREFRALISAVIAAAVLSAVPAAFLGWDRNVELHRRWYQVVIRPAFAENYYNVIERNESVPAAAYAYNKLINRECPPRYLYILKRLRGVNAATAVLFGAVIAFFVVTCGLIRKRAAPAAADNLLLALIVLTGVLLQPLAWLQHFAVAIFTYMAVLYYAPQAKAAGVRYACYALVAFSFAGHSLITADLWGAETEAAFFRLKTVTWGMLLLYAAVVTLLFVRCRRPRRAAARGGR